MSTNTIDFDDILRPFPSAPISMELTDDHLHDDKTDDDTPQPTVPATGESLSNSAGRK
ncbi:MAG: hypothetical protein OXC62_07245 [Aestuariivita sp.]|nr:hypothetical protein [Aestuariivita sp.]